MATSVPRSCPRRPEADTSAASRAPKASIAQLRASSSAAPSARSQSEAAASISPCVTERKLAAAPGGSCQPTCEVIPPPLSIPIGRGTLGGSVKSATCCTAPSSARASSSPLRLRNSAAGTSSRSSSPSDASMRGVTLPAASACRSPPVAPITVEVQPVATTSSCMLATHRRSAEPPSVSTSTIRGSANGSACPVLALASQAWTRLPASPQKTAARVRPEPQSTMSVDIWVGGKDQHTEDPDNPASEFFTRLQPLFRTVL
mmetsp:Transcript_1932/g.5423  ORF Transcript_1932/g.5423 Transcript_1932/m.5423 type:complete len:260 (+) Transcript_1932:364-1143(+)